METPDDKTFVIRLGMPQPSFLDALASPWGPKVISPKALADHAGDDNATGWLNDNAVGTGPFMLTSFNRGEEIVLDRYDGYHGPKPYFDESPDPDRARHRPADPAAPLRRHRCGAQQLPVGPARRAAARHRGHRRSVDGADRGRAQAGHAADRGSRAPQGGADGDEPEGLGRAGLRRLRHARRVGLPGGDAQARDADRLPRRHGGGQGGHREGRRPQAHRRRAGRRDAQRRHRGRPHGRGDGRSSASRRTITVLPQGAIYALTDDLAAAPDLVVTRMNPDAAHPENQATVFYTAEAPLNFYKVAVPEADALVQEAGTKTDVAERNALYEKAGQMYFDSGYFIPLVDIEDVVVHKAGLVDLGLRPVFPPGNIDFGTVRWAE